MLIFDVMPGGTANHPTRARTDGRAKKPGVEPARLKFMKT